MGQVSVYNCSPVQLTRLTVNGVNAISTPIPPIANTSPAVSVVTLPTGANPPAFPQYCTIAVYFGLTTPSWTASIQLTSTYPIQNYSLWCFINGMYLCNYAGVITGNYWQRLFATLKRTK